MNRTGLVRGLRIKKLRAPASLSEMAYETVKASLISVEMSRWPAEARIDEREMAARLGISRTPLRQAIHRLVSEGFLQVAPRRGIYVVKKTKQEIVEILIVRAALEGMAARLATRYITDDDIRKMRAIFAPFDPATVGEHAAKYSDANIEFHERVVGISRCGKLIELAGNLLDHIKWVRFRAGVFQERHRYTLPAHLQIIEALERRDPELAERRMREHIERLARYIEEHVDSLP